jgi:hypothetical protein
MVSNGLFLKGLIIDALISYGGVATMLNVSKWIWENHQSDLEEKGDLFYRWQYEMRWAATSLRKEGTLLPPDMSDKGIWVLNEDLVN